jgi:hypothetical protein
MSWRLAPLVACFALACSSGTMKVKKGEPQTAREKMLAEQKASKKNMDDEEVKPPGSKQWTGWRYQGNDEHSVSGALTPRSIPAPPCAKAGASGSTMLQSNSLARRQAALVVVVSCCAMMFPL